MPGVLVMTDVDDWRDPCRDDREPDESDYAEARDNEEYWQHCDDAHGGERCDCPQPEWPDGPFTDEPPF